MLRTLRYPVWGKWSKISKIDELISPYTDGLGVQIVETSDIFQLFFSTGDRREASFHEHVFYKKAANGILPIKSDGVHLHARGLLHDLLEDHGDKRILKFSCVQFFPSKMELSVCHVSTFEESRAFYD